MEAFHSTVKMSRWEHLFEGYYFITFEIEFYFLSLLTFKTLDKYRNFNLIPTDC